MELIGHKNTKSQITIAQKSAQERNTSLPHIMFAGVAGCGKTSMGRYIAHRCSVDFLAMPAREFKDHKSIIKILEKLNHDGYDEKGNRTAEVKPTILFIDEIHRMPTDGEEQLGIAMEDFKLAAEEGGYYWVPHFTVIGATTNDGLLSRPFRERFELRFIFDTYSEEEIIEIIQLHTKILKKETNLQITGLAMQKIAERGRGIPRISVGYLKRARDLAVTKRGMNLITSAIVEETFDELGVDAIGLNQVELKVLRALYDANIPIGLENLSIISNASPKALSESAEPFLIRLGFMIRSGRGRIITSKGKKYLEGAGYKGKNRKVLIKEGYVRA
jgi:Holliday junction DNA helicase RuvB